MWRLSCLSLIAACSGKAPSVEDSNVETTPEETTDSCRRGPCDTTDTPTSATGASLLVTFSISSGLIDDLDGPPEGPFRGEVYRSEDVGALGPDDDAVALGEISIDLLVLPEDGSSTEVLFTLQPVPPLTVTILGFVDVDGNSDPDEPEPDRGDPVTLPNDNSFELQPDVENTVDVFFGLLNPF